MENAGTNSDLSPDAIRKEYKGMTIKKKNALFGRYPSCDHLNNALRFLREGEIDEAVEEIIFAIEKAGGYFHEDNVQMVEEAKERWKEIHMKQSQF